MLHSSARLVRFALSLLALRREYQPLVRIARFAPAVALAAGLAGCGGGSGSQSALIPGLGGGGAGGTRYTAATAALGVSDASSVWNYQSPVSVPWPKGAPASGDVLIACAESQWQGAPQTPAGWTALSTASTGFGTALFYKIAGAGEPASVSFAIPTPFNISAAMVRISGAASTVPLWSHVAGTSTTVTTAPVVPNVIGMLPIACFGGVNAGAFSIAGGWTLGAKNASSFSTMIEARKTITADTTTGISVAATAATAPTASDAYGVLVAPAATPAPVQTPVPGTLAVRDGNSAWYYAAPLTMSWPKGAPANGDLLIACAESQWQATPQTPAGWTALSASNSAFGTALFYKIAGAAEPSAVTFTIPTPFNISAAMIRIAGAATSAPLWSHTADTGATITTAPLVPNVLGMLPIACFGGVNAGAYSIASGWALGAQNTASYSTTIEARTTTTSDTSTGITVAAAPATSATVNDAYGVLVAPLAAATPAPIQTPAPTALAIRDANSAWYYAAPLTLPWPNGAPANGDLLIACAEGQWQATPQTPAGWTALSATNSAFGTALFYKIAGAAEPSAVTFTIPTPFNISAAMIRIAGAAAAAPIWSHATNFGATTIATTPLVPSVLGMLPVACFGGVNAGGAYSIASGWAPGAQNAASYSTTIETGPTTTDTVSGMSVAAVAPAASTVNDAYGVLVAPLTAATPGPSAITLSPASIDFLSTTDPTQTVTASQAGNAAFSANSQNCSNVATISAAGNGQFTVAPLGAGVCSFTITGANGQSATLNVSTTTTSITTQSRRTAGLRSHG